MDEDDDAANRAYNSIAAQLAQFTSPQLGSLPPRYQDESDDADMDDIEWMEQDLQIHSPPPKTPKRTPILERANTPVMSNSTSKKTSYPSSPPAPVATPAAVPRVAAPSPRPVVPTSSHQSPFIYRRYHEILAGYLKAKRSLTNSLELERRGQALEPMTLGSSVSSLAAREQRTELDFLSQLQQVCWSSAFPLEGDVWMLLVSLRQLGLPALVWDNDPTSQAQNALAVQGFAQQLVCSIHDTPERILQRLKSTDAPLVLQRRYAILVWIQTCLDQIRAEPPKTRPAAPRQKTHPDDPSAAVVPEDSFLEASLGLILAGRLEEAQELARAQGQPWRAAVWAGAKPYGIKKTPNPKTKTVDTVATGNPHRFLWKRQMFRTARRAPPAEAAIAAVLSNDVATCLANPHLRNWSHALCATFMGVWGRIEDEILVKHNTERRKEALPFPGTEHIQKEHDQLLATSQLSAITEDRALMLLRSSPFEELKGKGVYEEAMAAFLDGKSSILEYCRKETAVVFGEDKDEDSQLAHLRFLTHLTCFLESLQVSTTSIVLSDLTKRKNEVLFQYIQYLESRPELWSMVTMYVGLLPDEKRLLWFPSMLAKVLEDFERQAFLQDMQAYFPQDVLPILRTTVRLCLNSRAAPDHVKVQSLNWLLMDEAHAEEAIICSNLLLRQLFMYEDDDKLDLAMQVVEDVLPEKLVVQCESASARVEHMAFLAYLEAYRTFSLWKEHLVTTSTRMADDLQIDMKNLTTAEQDIAKQRLVRDWARQKRDNSQTFLKAAEDARTVLLGTLMYPGGWLSQGEDDEAVTSEEQRQRLRDMKDIQSRYLALAVNLYHQVCEETALWLSRCLDNALHIMTRSQALESLKDPLFQPDLWYQNALNLAVVVADDRYGVHHAIGANALKELLAKLAETAVSQLMK